MDVKFRLLVFRPYVGEVLFGAVKSCDEVKGIEVSMEFFDGVYIPPAGLFTPSALCVWWLVAPPVVTAHVFVPVVAAVQRASHSRAQCSMDVGVRGPGAVH